MLSNEVENRKTLCSHKINSESLDIMFFETWKYEWNVHSYFIVYSLYFILSTHTVLFFMSQLVIQPDSIMSLDNMLVVSYLKNLAAVLDWLAGKTTLSVKDNPATVYWSHVNIK